MRADGIVVAPPVFDKNLGLLQGVEDLSIQQFIAQPRVEPYRVRERPSYLSPASGIERRVTAHSGRVGLASELTSRGAVPVAGVN